MRRVQWRHAHRLGRRLECALQTRNLVVLGVALILLVVGRQRDGSSNSFFAILARVRTGAWLCLGKRAVTNVHCIVMVITVGRMPRHRDG